MVEGMSPEEFIAKFCKPQTKEEKAAQHEWANRMAEFMVGPNSSYAKAQKLEDIPIDNGTKISHFIHKHAHDEWVLIKCHHCNVPIAQIVAGSKVRIKCRRCKNYTVASITGPSK